MPLSARPCHGSATFGSYKTESCLQSWLEAVWMFVMTHVIKLECPAWLPRQHAARLQTLLYPLASQSASLLWRWLCRSLWKLQFHTLPLLPPGLCDGEHAVCIHACASYGRTLAGFFHFLPPRCLETGSLTDPDACDCC